MKLAKLLVQDFWEVERVVHVWVLQPLSLAPLLVQQYVSRHLSRHQRRIPVALDVRQFRRRRFGCASLTFRCFA